MYVLRDTVFELKYTPQASTQTNLQSHIVPHGEYDAT